MKKLFLLLAVFSGIVPVNAQRIMGLKSSYDLYVYKISQDWDFVYDGNGLISEIHGISKSQNQVGEIIGEMESNATLSYDLTNNIILVSYENKNLKGPENLTGSFTCFLENDKIVKENDPEFGFDNLKYDEKGRVIKLPSEYEESSMMERDNNGYLKAFNDNSGYYSFSYCDDDVTENSKRLVGFPTLFFYDSGLTMPIEMICNFALQYQGFFGEPEPQLLSSINFSEDGIYYENLYKFEYEIDNKLVVGIFCNSEEKEDNEGTVEIPSYYKISWDSEAGIAYAVNHNHNKIQYYDLNGKKITAPQKGLSIVKMPDGQIKKVVIK